MAKAIRNKESFGTVAVARVGPKTFEETAPPAINIVVGFEDALKLCFGIEQCLAQLNKYDRNASGGRATAVNLCLFINKGGVPRITVMETRIPKPKSPRKTKR
jgi:hypothetical protein